MPILAMRVDLKRNSGVLSNQSSEGDQRPPLSLQRPVLAHPESEGRGLLIVIPTVLVRACLCVAGEPGMVTP